jgi:hypothetical protein
VMLKQEKSVKNSYTTRHHCVSLANRFCLDNKKAKKEKLKYVIERVIQCHIYECSSLLQYLLHYL